MKKILASFIACASILSVAAGPAMAYTLYGEVQRGKVVPENKIGPKFVWTAFQPTATAELFSDLPGRETSASITTVSVATASFTTASVTAFGATALIMGGTGVPIPEMSIDFDISGRYLLGAAPTITIEWFNPVTKTFSYENLLFDKFQITDARDGYKHATRKIKKPTDAVSKRVAIAAIADGNTAADLIIRNFKIDGNGADSLGTVPIIDRKGVDPLLNIASHLVGN